MSSDRRTYPRHLISILCLLLPLFMSAQEKISINLATGGFNGAFQLGAGYHFHHRIIPDIDLMYGYSRVYDADVHSIRLNADWDWNLKRYNKWQVETGLGLAWYAAPNVYTFLPEQYPSGYYKPTSFQGILKAGIARSFVMEAGKIPQSFELALNSNFLLGQAWYALINNHPSLQSVPALSLTLRYDIPKISD